MKELEKYISPYIEQQFPDFYKEDGEEFILFVKAYYEWLESNDQVIYHAKRLPDYRDIDKTLDKFIVHFKEKYLKNIQFTTASNKRLFIKNALDFYRSKGTERSVDLFFKLIYGLPSKIYTPGDDLFKLSSGEWEKPIYLEVTKRKKNVQFVGKQIYGLNTGSSAFVERLVRKKSKGKYIDIFYISNLSGDFESGEIIKFDSDINDNPVIIGSLSSLDIISGGSNFEKGEQVQLISNNGSFGKGVVTSVSNTTGQVSFALQDGGYAYTTNSEILISNVVIIISNIVITNPNVTSFEYFKFKKLYQPLANITFNSVDGGTFAAGDVIETYYANGATSANANILSVSFNSSTNTGEMFVCKTGNLESNTTIYKLGNTITAEVDSYTDKLSYANSMYVDPNVILHANSVVGSFIPGESLIQYITPTLINAGGVVQTLTANSGVLDIQIINGQGLFFAGYPLLGLTSGTSATLQSYGTKIGMIEYVGSFTDLPGNYGYEELSNTYAIVDYVSTGSGANFSVDTLLNKETISLNSDKLSDYANVRLNAVSYGFPADPAGNATSNTINNLISRYDQEIGTIGTIGNINKGTNYTYPPYINVYEPKTASYKKRSKLNLSHTSASKSFSVGEIVNGLTSNTYGTIVSTNSTYTILKNLSLFKEFQNGETFIGTLSGATANVVSFSYDLSSGYVGYNAVFSSNVQISNGSVDSLEIIDSGIGYIPNENLTFYSSANNFKTGSALSRIEKQGFSQGFYRNNGGFLSDNKYLHDGDYYQEYSYEILTALPFETYSSMFKKVLHIAGTKVFGKYSSENYSNNEITLVESSITLI